MLLLVGLFVQVSRDVVIMLSRSLSPCLSFSPSWKVTTGEDIFVPPEDADPVTAPPAGVGEAADTQADGQVSQKVENQRRHLEKSFVLNQEI